jgi:hypothetical protein
VKGIADPLPVPQRQRSSAPPDFLRAATARLTPTAVDIADSELAHRWHPLHNKRKSRKNGSAIHK